MGKARYIRLADMLSTAIQEGKLTPGTKLPTHRAFAEQFNIALATATRAYGELERRGLIVGEAGRGTFVRDLGLPPTLGVRQTASDGLIDLVFNMPGDAADADMLRAGLRRLAAAGDLEAMLRYQPHGGRTHERRIIAESLASTLGPIDPECLLVTSGGQHGLATIALGLFQRGERIATDTLTYPGFKSVAALQGLEIVPVEGRGGVMDPDDLERQCRARKLRAVYLMPTVHNPLGAVMNEATRLRLIEIARTHDLLLIEDAAYTFLEPDPPPSLIALAPERTVYVGGFSKSLATGLRLGYLIAPATHTDRLLEAIRATTWNAPALISGLVTGWVEDGTLAGSEETRRRDGAERQRLCRTVLGGSSVLSHRYAGFAWLPLDKGVRSEPIVTRLKEQGVLASGAEPFATTIAVPQALRLAFGGVRKDELKGVFQTVREAVEEASI
ncbi:PLP-dependent aminotransferase family protein [Tritonibacter scottomollicae]|uniref:GntR family transcriptional regulator n=1 Tax=Tritonibacter scottomollicae TaxID=483013 RepID=A0A2T0ZZU1_TRISK|nr:PLP-dependent aminotransferase family protein [Tritonibacter scottomollicae]PRZ41873.1 GntR family transcriptional regulator [Tritonibacter scottomollicae]